MYRTGHHTYASCLCLCFPCARAYVRLAFPSQVFEFYEGFEDGAGDFGAGRFAPQPPCGAASDLDPSGAPFISTEQSYTGANKRRNQTKPNQKSASGQSAARLLATAREKEI